MTLPRGLYQRLLTEALQRRLDEADGLTLPLIEPLQDAEAADRLALHVAQLVERAISVLPDGERAQHGLVLARSLIEQLVAW
ncbi:MAG: hypothetical protein RLZ83_1053, partial [Pseudomonadota bacterium]